MRRFTLYRDVDFSGVSGTGIIAEGVAFSSGKVVMEWITELSSMSIYGSVQEMLDIHGHSGTTHIIWIDAEAERTV